MAVEKAMADDVAAFAEAMADDEGCDPAESAGQTATDVDPPSQKKLWRTM